MGRSRTPLYDDALQMSPGSNSRASVYRSHEMVPLLWSSVAGPSTQCYQLDHGPFVHPSVSPEGQGQDLA